LADKNAVPAELQALMPTRSPMLKENADRLALFAKYRDAAKAARKAAVAQARQGMKK
jgi:hypothetical protein